MATETLPIHRPVNRTAERLFFAGFLARNIAPHL